MRGPSKPIALTIGDPSGIGPEISAKAWRAVGADIPLILLGDPAHVPRGVDVNVIATIDEANFAQAGALNILTTRFAAPAVPGAPDPANAAGVIGTIEQGAGLALDKQVAALVTNPISKSVLIDGAGFAYPGHTEFLADLAGAEHVVMMLASPRLRVVPATIHIPLAQVPHVLCAEGLEATIRITHQALIRDFGISAPRLAVAGLNPHAGEDGKMGTEDRDLISPVLDGLRREGMQITGPLSADTMFHAGARVRYDAAIAMYHDQALIPIKTLDFDKGVNVTLGLPFVRTSPDHGTAFDIAGQGIASPDSLIEAIKLARDMALARG